MFKQQNLVAAALLGSAFFAAVVAPASASTATCSSEFNAANGTESSPYTNIGTVQAGCEIGPFTAYEGGGTNLGDTVASVGTGSKPNPSIYQFEWGGGNLTIEEMIGNNGTGDPIFVELGTTQGTGSALSSPLASITITGQNTTPTDVITDMYLASGTYLLDNFLDNSGTLVDPNYAVLFTPVSSTPLPASLPLFAGGLGFIGYLTRRRKQNGKQALAAA